MKQLLSTLLIGGWITTWLLGSAAAQDPVDLKVLLDLEDQQPSVVVVMDIESGWHAYGKLSDATPGIETEVSFSYPDGVQPKGELQRPEGEPYEKDFETLLLKGKSKFRQQITIDPSNEERTLKIKIRYQVCNDRLCQPPKTVTKTLSVPASQSTADDSAKIQDDPFVFDNQWFEPPKQLMVNGSPLNTFAKKSYPSPALYDIDSDGQTELIVGDISGAILVYERTDASDGLTWKQHRVLKNVEGKEISVNNW